MAQTLESVSAYPRAQAELPLEKPKRYKLKAPTRLSNDEWNLLMQGVFDHQDIHDLAQKFDVSIKTIYAWRRQVMNYEEMPRFTLSDDTKKVMKKSRLYWFDKDNTYKLWVYKEDQPVNTSLDEPKTPLDERLARLRVLRAEDTMKKAKDAGMSLSVDGEYIQVDSPSEPDSGLVDRLKEYKPEIIKILKEQPVGIEHLLSNLQKREQEQTAVESSTLLQAPSGDRFLTDVNDLQLMTFLKLQGFTLYKISLDKI